MDVGNPGLGCKGRLRAGTIEYMRNKRMVAYTNTGRDILWNIVVGLDYKGRVCYLVVVIEKESRKKYKINRLKGWLKENKKNKKLRVIVSMYGMTVGWHSQSGTRPR